MLNENGFRLFLTVITLIVLNKLDRLNVKCLWRRSLPFLVL